MLFYNPILWPISAPIWHINDELSGNWSHASVEHIHIQPHKLEPASEEEEDTEK